MLRRKTLEYLAHRQLSGEPLNQATIDRVLKTIKPVASAMWRIYKRVGNLPRLRYRGFVFTMTITPGDVIDVQFFRESDLVNVE